MYLHFLQHKLGKFLHFLQDKMKNIGKTSMLILIYSIDFA